jgi:hypothetical protein
MICLWICREEYGDGNGDDDVDVDNGDDNENGDDAMNSMVSLAKVIMHPPIYLFIKLNKDPSI